MPRTTNPISKLPSGSWQVRFRDDQGVQRKRTFPTASQAQAFLDQTRANVRTGTYITPDAGRETFSAYALQWGEAQDWTYGTRENFRACLKRLDAADPGFTSLRLDAIDPLRLQQLRRRLSDRYNGQSPATALHYAYAVMRAAYQNGRLPRDPTIGVKPPKARNGREPKVVDPYAVPSAAEVAAIISATPDHLRAAVALGACGLRIGEVMGVTTSRLDLDDADARHRPSAPAPGPRVRARAAQAGQGADHRAALVGCLELRRHLPRPRTVLAPPRDGS